MKYFADRAAAYATPPTVPTTAVPPTAETVEINVVLSYNVFAEEEELPK